MVELLQLQRNMEPFNLMHALGKRHLVKVRGKGLGGTLDSNR